MRMLEGLQVDHVEILEDDVDVGDVDVEDVLVDEVELEEVEVDKVLEDEVGVEVPVVLLLLAVDEGLMWLRWLMLAWTSRWC